VPELDAARRSLVRYELGPSGTLSVLSELSALVARPELAPKPRQEARFLRAAVAGDLLVLARLRHDSALQPALERALGVASGSAFAYIDAELATFSGMNYAGIAAELRREFALAREPRAASLARFQGMSGSQRDLLFLDAVAEAAGGGHEPLGMLASYGEDPCAGVPACPAEYAAFDRRGRMAVAALAEAGRAMIRTRAAVDAGDPLAVTAAMEFAELSAALSKLELRPWPAFACDACSGSEAPAESGPDLVITVVDKGVRYGFVPRVRLLPTGQLESFGATEPVLPAVADLPFRSAMPPFYIRRMPELVDWLRATLDEGPDRKIAITAEVGVPSHMLGRALASLKAAGRDEAVLIGRACDGVLRAETIRIVSKEETEAAPAELSLRVRLGGYSLRLPERANTQDIPRVRDAQGLRFDTAALSAQLGERSFVSSEVSFMFDVPSDQLTAALLAVAPKSRSLELLLQ
jgi:hypothetical protein